MKNKWLYWCFLITLIFLCLPATAWAADNPVGVSYRGHIQDLGDYPRDGSWVDSPDIIGTVGQSKRIEGFEIKLTRTVPEGMELRYNVHVQNKGWLYNEDDPADWPKDGAYAGTRGDSLRIEAVKIVLTDSAGKAVTGYSVQYRGHVQNAGDLPTDKTQWLADGAQLGTVGSSLRLEALLVQVVKTGTDPVEPTEPQVYNRAGTYGPDQGSETIAGDVTITADGVILQNLVITGNLTISEAVGDGNVTLNNVTVKGDTFVRGGGVNSIKINGGKYSRIVMEKTASGAVRIVAIGVDELPVIISEAAAGETIILEGAFESVTVDAPNMNVTTQGNTTTIGKLTVGAGAGGTTLNLATGTSVTDLVLAGKAAVKGQGNVAKAEVKADGVVFEKKPGSYSVEPEVVVPPVFPSDGGGGGYNPPSPPPTVAVTGVSLNQTALERDVDTSAKLTATVAPSNATNQAVRFSSDNLGVVVVDDTGNLRARGVGTATITVTTVDGGWTATCQVTVRPLLRRIDSQLLAGTSDNYLYLKLTGDILDSNTQYIFDAGTTGLSLGIATENGTNECKVALAGIAKPGTLTLRATNLACGMDSNLLTMEILEPTASLVSTGVEATTASFSFTAQSGASAVTLQQKLASEGDSAWAPAQLVAPLNAQATAAMVTGLTSGESYDFRLLVVGGATPGVSNLVLRTTRVPVTTVSLDQTGPFQLKFGETVTLTATVAPATATDQTVSWISSNPAVLRSDGGGKFTAIGAGNASIVAVATESEVPPATCPVSVTASTPIRAEAITAVAEPFVGLTPTSSFAVLLPDNATREYSGAVAWTETGTTTPVSTFDGSKAYTATLTLTAEPGYQFTAGTAFSVAGADSVATTIGTNGLTATVTANYAVKDRYEIDSGGIITAYSGPGGELVVPGMIDGKNVTGIDSSAFSVNMSLTKVTLPDTIQSLSWMSFQSCLNLQAINIPKGLTSIPVFCFSGCSKLETVTISPEASLQTIDEYAFLGTKLKTMTIPATVTAIEDNAFENCNQLKAVSFTANSQLKTIGDNAFNFCALTELNLPATVTAIGENAFVGNKLTKLMLNNSDGAALFIGSDAFSGSPQIPSQNPITEITLPAGVSLPIDTQADIATMGLYGSAFKSFYESTEAGGNNRSGGTFVCNVATNQWSKNP